MGKKVKIGLLCTLLVLALSAGTLALMYYVLQVPVFDRSGWVYTQDAIQYHDYYAKPLTGWQHLDGECYYFYPSGNLATGLSEIEGERYLLSQKGTRQSGWVKENGASYFLNEDGTLYTGWLEQDGKQFFLSDDGKQYIGFLDREGKRCYLSQDGSIQTGWLETSEGRSYLNEEGFVVTGWLETSEGRYYLDDAGILLTGWLQTDTARYYLDDDGVLQTGFFEISGVRRYFLPDGAYIPLVNLWNSVPEDYTPQLTTVEDYQVDITCKDALETMMAKCREAGFEVHINSAYRDEAAQQELWGKLYDEYIENGYSPEETEKLLPQRVVPPGTSEHHLGLRWIWAAQRVCINGWRTIAGSMALFVGILMIKWM